MSLAYMLGSQSIIIEGNEVRNSSESRDVS